MATMFSNLHSGEDERINASDSHLVFDENLLTKTTVKLGLGFLHRKIVTQPAAVGPLVIKARCGALG
jgi:hypothetical protein